jgi:flagellar protein FlaG
MNFPDITSEMKLGLRSESVAPAQAVARAPVRSEETFTSSASHPRESGNTDADAKLNTISKEDAVTLASDIEKKLDANNVKLKFNIIEEDDTVQVEILNSEGKTIRKIPSDDLLKLSQSLDALDRGFIDKVS